jgi:hypothetical protein
VSVSGPGSQGGPVQGATLVIIVKFVNDRGDIGRPGDGSAFRPVLVGRGWSLDSLGSMGGMAVQVELRPASDARMMARKSGPRTTPCPGSRYMAGRRAAGREDAM